MSLIQLSHVTKYYGAELILDDVSFRLDRSDHAALVGTNGAGKSTLLRIMAGLEEPDSGSVSTSRNLRLVYLAQEPRFDERASLFDTMLDTFREVIEAQNRLRTLEGALAGDSTNPALLEEYAGLQALVEHTGYDYREQIERVLVGLELPAELWYGPMSSLSGGQRTRANLARTLLQDSDLLLLDEPTNHLDIGAVEWLEGYLRDSKRAFLIVAHDRYLLDRVTTRTLDLSLHHVTDYDAPYSRFLQLRAERAERQRLEYEAQQQHIAKTEDFIRRYGAGQRYKEARGRQKRLDRLERIERPAEEDTVNLRLSRAARSGDIVLEIRDLVAGYPDKPLVRVPGTVVVRRGERVAVVGPNGSGKTTLLRTLVGQLPPLGGTVHWGARTDIAYYSQTLGQLDERHTVIEEIQAARPMSEEEARGFLGSFLFSGDDAFKTVSMLSGGERSRVALAKLILEAPNVLVLDEPTNHLDIASRDALQKVLSTFEGTLLFVSHDRFLIDALAQQLWVLSNGTLRRYDGGYSGYAAGTARPLEYVEPARNGKEGAPASPLKRVLQLETEALGLASQLADLAPTASLGQLAELSARYSDIIGKIDEADWQWLQSVRKQTRGSSV